MSDSAGGESDSAKAPKLGQDGAEGIEDDDEEYVDFTEEGLDEEVIGDKDFSFDPEDEDFLANTGDENEAWADVAAPDETGALVDTGRQDWGEVGLTLSRRLLEAEERAGLRLFSFRAVQAGRRIEIALDKPEDRWGSPQSEELDSFTRCLDAELTTALGSALADTLSLEVSSPGAERRIRVPEDLERFKELPMKVLYRRSAADGTSRPTQEDRILMMKAVDEAAGLVHFTLADVRHNRDAAGKGRRLGKKKLQEVTEIKISDIQRVNLHLDI